MKKVITFGEIMLRLSPPGHLKISQTHCFESIYGGGEANVAVSLANFGIDVEFVSRVPSNEIGIAATLELKKRGVGTSFMEFGGERLGIYFLETGVATRGSKVIYDRSHSSISEISKGLIDWEMVFEGADWFHWSGITPGISKSAAEVCMEGVRKASQMGLTISTDLNYREKLWKYGSLPGQIMPELVSYTDVLFCGKSDVEKCLNLDFGNLLQDSAHLSPEEFLSFSNYIKSQFPTVKKVVSTFRKSYSSSHNSIQGAINDGVETALSSEFQINPIVDRIGAGDAFMGGLIYGLLKKGWNIQRALEFGIAASCLKHTIIGDVNLSTVEEVESLISGKNIGSVSR